MRSDENRQNIILKGSRRSERRESRGLAAYIFIVRMTMFLKPHYTEEYLGSEKF